jgi:hypothetical protein
VEGERAEDIVEFAGAAGLRVSRDQLVRWHRAGLISRPLVRHLGRGRGTESWYPAGTAAQIVALVQLQGNHRRLADVGWLLWWDGYPVADRVVLDRLRTVICAWTSTWASLIGTDGILSKTSAQALRTADKDRLGSRTLRWTRQRVGPSAFASFLADLLTAVSSGGRALAPEQVQRIAQGLGLDTSTDEEPTGAGASETKHLATTFDIIAEVLAPERLGRLIDNLRQDHLVVYRDQVRSFTSILTTFGDLLRATSGRWGFNLGAHGAYISDIASHPDGQAFLVLVWAGLDRGGHLSQASVILDLAPEAETTKRAWAAMQAIRSQLPPDERYVLRPARLGRAMNNHDEQRQLEQDIGLLRERHRDTFDSILAEHGFKTSAENRSDR